MSDALTEALRELLEERGGLLDRIGAPPSMGFHLTHPDDGPRSASLIRCLVEAYLAADEYGRQHSSPGYVERLDRWDRARTALAEALGVGD